MDRPRAIAFTRQVRRRGGDGDRDSYLNGLVTGLKLLPARAAAE